MYRRNSLNVLGYFWTDTKNSLTHLHEMKIKSVFWLSLLVSPVFILTNFQENIEPSLIRKPYLQSAISDSISILWRTDIGKISEVKYKLQAQEQWQSQPGLVRSTNTGWIENEVVIKNLTPGKKYRYVIFTDEVNLSTGKNYYFKSPKIATDTVFTFFAVGDIGESVELGGTPDMLGKALLPNRELYDLGLLLGDIVYPDGKSELYDENLFQYFTEVFPYVPVFPILGNHDWFEPDENYLLEWKLPHNEHYYSFDYGNVHFTALDTKDGDFYQYNEQIRWLENDLANISNNADWRVVALHYNGKSCTYKEDNWKVMELYPLFEKYDVDLVLNGHAHTYERLNPLNGKGEVVVEYLEETRYYEDPEGFISITIGSGGKLRGIGSDPKPFTPDPENCRHPNLVAATIHTWAYLEISVDGNNLRGKAYSTEDMKVVDEFKIEKN